MQEIKGIIPALVTLFTKHDELDEDGLRWVVKNAVTSGVHGLIVSGSLGEFPNLSEQERRRAIEIVVDETNGKVPVIAGSWKCVN